MGNRLVIPASAELETEITGIINQGPAKGEAAAVRVWAGHYSKGQQSGYERVLTKYAEIFIGGKRKSAYSYSGRNLDELDDDIANLRHLIT